MTLKGGIYSDMSHTFRS